MCSGLVFQAHFFAAEDPPVHPPEIGREPRPFRHVGEDVPFQVDPRRGLAEHQAAFRQAEDGPLGDIEDGQPVFDRRLGAEGDLLDLFAEFVDRPFADDPELPVAGPGDEAARREGPAEIDPLGVLRDVDEPAAARQPAAELRDVHVAPRVALRKTDERLVQPAAVVKIEDGAHRHHARGVQAHAEIQAALRAAAEQPVLHGEREAVGDALLGRDGRDVFRDADAEVHDAAGLQLQGGAPADDLFAVERDGPELRRAHAVLAGKTRIVLRAEILHAVFEVARHHDAVHEDAGELHLARVEGAGLHHALHLYEHFAARVPARHREVQRLGPDPLALKRDVPVLVGVGAGDQRAVDGNVLEKQEIFAVQAHQLDEVLAGAGARVHLPAGHARVDERAETHARQHARPVSCGGAQHLGQHALGEVVGLDFVLRGHRPDLPRHAVVPADGAAQQPFVRHVLKALGFVVALGRAEKQRQPLRFSGLQKPVLDLLHDLLRKSGAHESVRPHGRAVRNLTRRLLCRHELNRHAVSLRCDLQRFRPDAGAFFVASRLWREATKLTAPSGLELLQTGDRRPTLLIIYHIPAIIASFQVRLQELSLFAGIRRAKRGKCFQNRFSIIFLTVSRQKNIIEIVNRPLSTRRRRSAGAPAAFK